MFQPLRAGPGGQTGHGSPKLDGAGTALKLDCSSSAGLWPEQAAAGGGHGVPLRLLAVRRAAPGTSPSQAGLKSQSGEGRSLSRCGGRHSPASYPCPRSGRLSFLGRLCPSVNFTMSSGHGVRGLRASLCRLFGLTPSVTRRGLSDPALRSQPPGQCPDGKASSLGAAVGRPCVLSAFQLRVTK